MPAALQIRCAELDSTLTPVEELLVHALPQLSRFARRLAGDRAEACDLVQETCRRAIEARRQYRPGTDACAWFHRILQNIFRDTKKRRREVPLPDLPIVAPAPDAIGLWRQVEDCDFQLAVGCLPDPYRATYLRHAVDGAPYDQIAREMGINQATVGVRLLRARAKLRKFLSKRLGEDCDDA